MPMTSSLEVVLLPYGPSQAVGIPEDVAILVDVLEHRTLRSPVDPIVGDGVLAVAVCVGRSQDVQRLADDRGNAESRY